MMEQKIKPILPELTEAPVTSIFGFTSEQQERFAEIAKRCLIDPRTPEPRPQTILSLNGVPMLWRGSKHIVCGVSKARKTTYLTLITAILCGKNETERGFKVHGDVRVLYLDTEQARYDTQEILNRVAHLVNQPAENLSNVLQVASLNSNSHEEIKGVMEYLIATTNPDVVILDNWTDCVASVMDDTCCVEFSKQLRTLAESYKIAIYSVIHANESARKDDRPDLRGWAKEESRKSDGTTFLKDMGTHSQVSFRVRHKPPTSFAIGFDENDVPAIIDTTTNEEATKDNASDKYASIVEAITEHGASYTELIALIRNSTTPKIPETTAKYRVRKMIDAGVIVKRQGTTPKDSRYYKPQMTEKKGAEELPF